jgi:hypothetical protein
VCSFDPPDGVTKLTGASAWIDIIANSMPNWWQFSGGCRDGALRLSFDPGSCSDPWSGAAVGSLTYQVGINGRSGLARVTVSLGIPESMAGPVEPGTEYSAFRLVIDNRHTVGTCADCYYPMCIGFIGIWLHQPAGMTDHLVCTPLQSELATWQGGAVTEFGCPGTPFPWQCNVTPKARRTWGQIKSLYR